MIPRKIVTLMFYCLLQVHLISAIPYEAYGINKQYPPVARVNEPFNFQISNDTFKSTVNKYVQIDYQAFNLPDWLTFDKSSRTFSGTPPSSVISSENDDPEYFNFILQGIDESDDYALNETYTFVVTKHSSVELASNFNLLAFLKNFGNTNGAGGLILSPHETFNITFQRNDFIDTYDASAPLYFYGQSQQYNAPLPSWCFFDSGSIKFSGTAPAVNSYIAPEYSYYLSLIVTDIPGFSALNVPFQIVIGAHQLTTSVQNTILINITDENSFDYKIPLSDIYLDGTPINTVDIGNMNLQDAPSWVTLTNYTIQGTVPESSTKTSANFSLAFYDIYADVIYLNFEIVRATKTKLFAVSSLPNINATRGRYFSYEFLSSQFTDLADTDVSIDFSKVNGDHDWLTFDSNNLTLHGQVPKNFDKFDLGLVAMKEDDRQELNFNLIGMNPIISSSSSHSHSHSQSSSSYEHSSSSSYKHSSSSSHEHSSSSHHSSFHYSSSSHHHSSSSFDYSSSSHHHSSSSFDYSSSSHHHSSSSYYHYSSSHSHYPSSYSHFKSHSSSSSHNSTSTHNSTTIAPTNSTRITSSSSYSSIISSTTSSTYPASSSAGILVPASKRKSSHATAIACGVAIPIGCILLAAAIFFFFWRNRRNQDNKNEDPEDPNYFDKSATPINSNSGGGGNAGSRTGRSPISKNQISNPVVLGGPVPAPVFDTDDSDASTFQDNNRNSMPISEDNSNARRLGALAALTLDNNTDSSEYSSIDYDEKNVTPVTEKHISNTNEDLDSISTQSVATAELLNPFHPEVADGNNNGLNDRTTSMYMDKQPATRKSWRYNMTVQDKNPNRESYLSVNTVTTEELLNTQITEDEDMLRDPNKSTLDTRDSVFLMRGITASPTTFHSPITSTNSSPRKPLPKYDSKASNLHKLIEEGSSVMKSPMSASTSSSDELIPVLNGKRYSWVQRQGSTKDPSKRKKFVEVGNNSKISIGQVSNLKGSVPEEL
ncbi:hypothetical protein TBLA_0J02020 [Henningerozyma blattae CBS 6284]|uniref:Dystroglycan-type cadherin-like domain-containing protein n=1 Tax=Henningerozyma blattae (strain ATCC 34711 / CBS 6284 / DSM 70876 / NBRC 10599 / NRRL Y-10934 / UCD 77-7) TaxID=1071380 RepID=I2H9Z4_HENB6|nr:hypothetical protein TBLA_0J02020 [Tetrapisispora blattae CBS 6284]CCH63196.1 hypothetical protein TBLA_0J02020 [Tetrapisispora blattae CBS 6284]